MHLAVPDLAALAGSRLFTGVPADTLRGIAETAVLRDVAPGVRVITPGERHPWLYVVLRGELGVFADEGAKLALSKIGAGDCAGEQSVLDHGTPSALVVATAPSRLAVLGAEQMWEAMRRAPVTALNLLHVLSERIRRDDVALRATFDRQVMFEAATSTDSITGLHNRHWMEETFERELLRCGRAGKPASLFMIDIDHFKDVNDKLGHRVGDAVLARLGDLMRRALRARVDAQPAQVNRDIMVSYTVSIGVAEWLPGSELAELIENANAALDDAKRAGRNRVQLAGSRTVPAGKVQIVA